MRDQQQKPQQGGLGCPGLGGCWGAEGSSHTGLPHQHTGGMGRPPRKVGPGMGQKRPNSRKHHLGFLFLPIAGEEGCFWKPPQRPTTVDGPLLSTRLLLAILLLCFVGNRGKPGEPNKQCHPPHIITIATRCWGRTVC